MAIGDLIKSTLGPKGMDKILWGTGRNEGVVEVSLMKIVFWYIFLAGHYFAYIAD
jgi:hypothetical protein